MNAGSRGQGDLCAKEERDQDQDQGRVSLAPSRLRRWSAFRNPRIVCVSRTFGGKDRHSKVCTVRGLRDRRIRLSVPTAVQLYDLQDKLGVSQPSKVIDWLINATKHEIDKLPPLQMPPGFGGFPLVSPELSGAPWSSLAPFYDMSSSTFLKHGMIDPLRLGKNEININENLEREDATSGSMYWDANDPMRSKGKEVKSGESHPEKANFVEPNVPAPVNFLPLPNLSSHCLPLSHQLEGQHGFMSQSDRDPFANHSGGIASSLSLSSISSPSYYSPSTRIIPQNFPPYNNATPNPLVGENNFQLLNSGQSFMPSRHLFGPITSRPIFCEYFKSVLCPENKTENLPSV